MNLKKREEFEEYLEMNLKGLMKKLSQFQEKILDIKMSLILIMAQPMILLKILLDWEKLIKD